MLGKGQSGHVAVLARGSVPYGRAMDQDRELLFEIARLRAEGQTVALATISATRGSTPRKVGARMLVRPDGSIAGTIGGGCGEAEVYTVMLDVLRDGEPRLVTVDLTTDVEGDDKICGGIMDVYVEAIRPA